MTTAQQALVDRVLQRIDALDAPGASITAPPIEVYRLLCVAVREVLLAAPVHLVQAAGVEAEAPAPEAGGRLPLPADFLRLLVLACDGYAVPLAQEDVAADGDAYREYLRGQRAASAAYPAAFRVPYSGAGGAVEALHLMPEPGAVTLMRYVPELTPEQAAERAPRLLEVMLWRAAMYVAGPLDPQAAAMAEANAQRALESAGALGAGRSGPRGPLITRRAGGVQL